MGLFSESEEQRQERIAAKQAETKRKAEEYLKKKDAEDRALLAKYGLDLDNYSDEKLRAINTNTIRDINTRLAGSGLYEWGSLLTSKSDVSFQLALSKVQMEQNWILMRQNEEMIRLLRQIAEK